MHGVYSLMLTKKFFVNIYFIVFYLIVLQSSSCGLFSYAI